MNLSVPSVSFISQRFVALLAGCCATLSLPAQVTFTLVDPPSFPVPDAGMASSDGSVLAGTTRFGTGADSTSSAFRWTAAGGTQYLGLVPGKESTYARGISGDGSIIVGLADHWEPGQPTANEAFRWTEATGTVGLGYLPGGTRSEAFGISTNGEVIVGYGDGGAFRWTESGGMEAIGPGLAYGVSANGRFIVGEGFLGFPNQAFLWSEETGMMGLGSLPFRPNGSGSTAVTDDGRLVVGGAYDQYGVGHAFIWTPESGMRDLIDVLTNVYGLGDEVAGWNRLSVGSLSADGRYLSGRGLTPSGQYQHWLLDRGLNSPAIPPGPHSPPITPVPEPTTYALGAALILVGAVWHQRRRRSQIVTRLC